MKKMESNLTISEFATRLGVTVPTIRSYVREGKIEPSMVVGKHFYFSEDSVSKYLGIFSGKRRGNLEQGSCVAVLVISRGTGQAVPEEKIKSAMQKKGMTSFETCDFNKELQPDEVADFKKYCEEKGFDRRLREIIKQQRDRAENKMHEKIQLDISKAVRNIYDSDNYKRCMRDLKSDSISVEQRDRLTALKKQLDRGVEEDKKKALAYEGERIQSIRQAYSSEYVDEHGCIAPNAPEGSGTKYVEHFNKLQQKYLRSYRIKSYQAMLKYTVFKIVTTDRDTYETPFKNIFNRAYDKVFVVNMTELSDDWQSILSIISNGVVEVEELILEQ